MRCAVTESMEYNHQGNDTGSCAGRGSGSNGGRHERERDKKMLNKRQQQRSGEAERIEHGRCRQSSILNTWASDSETATCDWLTSSTSLAHFMMCWKDRSLVMSYTRKIPWAGPHEKSGQVKAELALHNLKTEKKKKSMWTTWKDLSKQTKLPPTQLGGLQQPDLLLTLSHMADGGFAKLQCGLTPSSNPNSRFW